MRYVYIGLNGGNLKPASADETWKRRYGDCKGKTVLLLAMLKEMGIEAAPVLVNTAGIDDGLGERLPNPGLFDHVVVRAMIGDHAYWLDGTLPAVVPPSTEPFLPYRAVLPLTADGSDLVVLPWRPLSRPAELTVLDLDARAGFGQPTKVVNTTIVRGIQGLQQQVQWSALTPDQMLAAFRQQAIGDTWRSIDSVDWHYDVPNAASVLTIKGTWVLDWTDDGNGAKSYALPGGGFSPPDRLGRSAEQDQAIPYANKRAYNCFVTTLKLPDGTKSSQWYTKDEMAPSPLSGTLRTNTIIIFTGMNIIAPFRSKVTVFGWLGARAMSCRRWMLRWLPQTMRGCQSSTTAWRGSIMIRRATTS